VLPSKPNTNPVKNDTKTEVKPEDNNVINKPNGQTEEKSSNTTVIIIAVCASVGGVIVIGGAIAFYICMKKRKAEGNNSEGSNASKDTVHGLVS